MPRWPRVSLALLLAATSAFAWAADIVVGSVVAARGAVFFESGAGRQAVIVNAPVHRGETIVTGDGKVKIALNDGSIVSIGENTRIEVAHYVTTPAGTNVTVNLLTGVLRPFVVKARSTGSFEVETQTAIAAVRGTDWVIEATPDRTSVALVRGVVAVTSRADRKATVVLRLPGHGTDVPRGGVPTPPAPWGIKRLADTLARATFD